MIVDSLTRLLPGLFMMIILWPYYALFYRVQIECSKPFYIAFFVTFFDTNNQVFCKTNSSGKTLDTRQKISCASLDTPDVSKALFKKLSKWSACELLVKVLL